MVILKPSLLAYGTLVACMGLTACGQSNTPTKTAEKSATSNSVSDPASGTPNSPTPTTGATGKKIHIATEGAYAPFNYVGADGKLGGFDVDVANALCAELKASCEITAQDFDGLIPALAAKKFDAIVAGMSITPERQQQVDFTTPYFKNTLVWLAPKSGKFNLQNISGFKLGGQRSTTPGTYLQEHYGKTNEIKLYDKYDNAYLDLKSGRVDAVLSEKVTGIEWLKKNADGFGTVGDEIDNNDNIAIAVRKGESLKGELDTALATLKANGTLAKLEKQYFGDNATPAPKLGTGTVASATTATATTVTTTTKSVTAGSKP